MGFVVVEKPQGAKTVSALPADVEALQQGSQTYFVSGGTHYMIYLSATGTEEYIVVDPPGTAATAATAAPSKAVPLTLPAGTPLPVRLMGEVNSGKNRTGDSFSAYLDQDLLVAGVLLAGKGAMVYGRVAEAAGGASGASKLVLELTGIKAGGKVVALSTDRVQAAGEKPKAGKKIVGGAALGAGIGHIIDDDGGAAAGAVIGTMGGMAAAASTPGGEVAFAAGTALTFSTSGPTVFHKSVNVASGP
jgi:hypothetical protein